MCLKESGGTKVHDQVLGKMHVETAIMRTFSVYKLIPVRKDLHLSWGSHIG